MRILVCGSRTWTDTLAIEARLSQLPACSTVIHGAAQGADASAGTLAARLGLSVEAYPADWAQHGRSAGFLRNRKMLDTRPDLVIAFWDGRSRGTQDCIEEAGRRGIPVEVVSPGSAASAPERAGTRSQLHPISGYAPTMRQQQQAHTEKPKRSASQLSEPLWTGRVVRHETFGNGVIVRVRRSDLFIDFPGHGEKWFELEDIGTWIEWVDLPNQAS